MRGFGLMMLVVSLQACSSDNNTQATISQGAGQPCVNGMSGPYPCNGVNLMASVPLSIFSATSGNDSWGWMDPTTNKEYALMGLNNGTAFLDVTTPDQPIYLGKLPTKTVSSPWRDIKVYNNHAFIVSEAQDHGMQIFDLSQLRAIENPPVTFEESAHYNGFGNAHNIVINETSGFVYAVGTNTFNGGAHVVNIQNPLNPIAAGGYADNGYTHDAQVVTYNGPDQDYQGAEIFIGSNENQVVIANMTDKANPQEIATMDYGQLGYTHQGWFDETQRYFIVGDETDELNFGVPSRTLIFDLSDLDNPTLSFEYLGTTNAIDHNGYVNGNSFYLAYCFRARSSPQKSSV